MAVKLTDVAEHAGVSPTTVSRVINRKGYLSQKTIDKVTKSMRELGYKPNNMARSLQGKSAKLVGLIFPKLGHVFYAELIDALEAELFKHGYKTIICNSQGEPDKEKEYLEMLEANQVDGIISSSHNLGINDYDRVSAPIVAFDRNLSPDIPVVASDNYSGGEIAANYLLKTGANNILMLTGNDDSNSPTSLRHAGFASVLPQAPIVNLPSHYSTQRKEMEIRQILRDHRPDGIFASDDLTAIQVQNIAQSMNLDLEVVGYDGTHYIEHYHPQLTTIKQPISEMAELMVEILLKRIKGQTLDHSGYILPVSLLASPRN
ncbi:LacI family DNA-binding transcriptional regulator [Streptococcus sp. NLN76]|uniref:LacI family DNA-binding transcriptional regulator n=1 Tax=Streptococcus sp. NLN76 TaxID=2822800 RepID=UPI0018AA39BE|nr:LacI family DNA-binding transcriptional regulator [Streptococcus sp. NLN76]MBF8970438.1 LacI family DNA-binding transcriptional regulator [Streptococcus sp. NLN76]